MNHFLTPHSSCMIIAEAGVNHNGSLDLAFQLVDAAVESGCDAVKFQLFNPENLVTKATPKADYQLLTTGQSGGQLEMLRRLDMPIAEQAQIKAYCSKRQILYMCTPYDQLSADQLASIGIECYKIASTDTTNLPFLKYLGQKAIPLILSTGMCSLAEVEAAVNALRQSSCASLFSILHCTSEYPAPIDELNLRCIQTMAQTFNCPVGYSDHTPGIGASPWAVAMGARIIEKHLTLDRNMEGPDHRASIEPLELKRLVQEIRQLESALGDGVKQASPTELKNRTKMRKSLVLQTPLVQGQLITESNLLCKRPGTGLGPEWYEKVLGKRALTDLTEDQPLQLGDIDWNS